jgi:hypothetical protein
VIVTFFHLTIVSLPFMIKSAVLTLLLSVCLNSVATPMRGGFTGQIYSGDGSYAGTQLADLVGKRVTGEFSYDTSALGNDDTYFPTIPLTYKLSVDSHTYVVGGNYQSLFKETDIGSSPDQTAHFLSSYAVSYDSRTTETNQFSLQLKHNGLGQFFSNLGDLSTLNFSTATGFSLAEANGGILFNIFGPQAGIGFSIDSAFGGPAEVPEPNSTSLSLLALAALFLSRARKGQSS